MFELLRARVTSCGASCIIAVIYRPGSEVITQAFYTELAKLLEYMASFASQFIVTGDLNVRFDQPEDAATAKVNDPLTSYGAVQHIDQPTHVRGGILNDVITSVVCPPADVILDSELSFGPHIR